MQNNEGLHCQGHAAQSVVAADTLCVPLNSSVMLAFNP